MAQAYAARMANGKAGKLHTEPDCSFIGNDVREVDPERHLREEWCRHCTGKGQPRDPAGSGHYESLLAAAERREGGQV